MQQPHRQSTFGAFFKGGMSGLLSGVVMALVVAAISPLFAPAAAMAATGYLGLAIGSLATTGAFMAACSTLFGGVMGAKHVLFDGAKSHTSDTPTMVPVPVQSVSGPAMAPIVAYDMAPEQASGKSWVADTGRSEGTNSRIQQILADGSLSDKDRASAILASREAELSTQASRS